MSNQISQQGDNAAAGPSSTSNAAPNPAGSSSTTGIAAKIAKNKRLPATMITPAGSVQPSTKSRAKDKQMSKKQKARSEKGRERAVELSGRLEEKVKGREERKAKRNKAKNAWD